MADKKLTLFMGRAGTGKSHAVYEWIKDKLDTCPGDPIIVLVPEAATYKAERDLAEFMRKHGQGAAGFTTVRVVGFNRLAYQVYQSLGAAAQQDKGLSKVGRNLLLRLVMKRNEKQLEVLGAAVKQPQFSDVLQGLIQECRSFKISTDALRQGADHLADGSLERKIKELALLMDAYEDLVETRMCDDRDGMELLIEALPQSPLMQKAHVAIDGFHWFTPLQYDLLHTLVQHAQDSVITVTMPTDPKAILHQSTPGALFNRPYELYSILQARYGSIMDVVKLEEERRFASPILQDLSQGFFASPQRASQVTEEADKIPLIIGHNREREADEVVRRMLALVPSKDQALQEEIRAKDLASPSDVSPSAKSSAGPNRWRDLMIVLRDSEAYGEVLEKTFAKYHVPYFMDRQRPMNTHPLAEMLLGLFEVVRFNYHHDSLFRLLKTDLIPMGEGLDLADSRARVDQLENYCLEFGIHHYKWSMPSWPWCRKGKDGKPYSPQEEERLAQVNESHNYLMAWLEDWFDFASHKDSQTGIAGHTGRQWAQEIFNLLERLGVPETLYDWAQEADRQGQPVEKVSHEQMYQKVLAFLDELVDLSGDEVLSLPEMALLLEEALGDINYSMVPPSLDHVLVTTVERGYTQERKHVFVMGLNDGLFPRKMGEEGLIKDKDRNALAEAGIHLAGGALTQAFNENFLFYLACTRATHSLTLSYANASGEGEPQEPSLVMKRLASLGYTQVAHKVPLHIEEGTETSYLWRPNQSLSLLASQWGNLLGGASLAQPWWALYEWALASQAYRPRLQQVTQGLFDNNEVPVLEPAVVRGLFLPHQYMTGSVTRLEKYEACPFKFLAEYGFKLQARKVASYGAPEIGTLLHDHLRALGEELLQEGRQWRDLGPEELHQRCQAIASHVMDESLLGYNNVTDAAYDKARYDRLVKTLEVTVARLADWSSKSDFTMTALEKSFGMHDEWPSVDVPLGKGQVLKLQGQIDRIDTWEDQGTTYGLIMDYKTGSAGISGGQLYYGLKLQLLTYWLAYKHVKGHEHVVPAGTIYTPVKNAKLSVSTPMSKEEAAQELATSSEFRSFGYFTDTPDVLMHMDALKADNKAGLYVPIRISSKGINGQDKWRTKSVGDYDIMADYVSHKMAQTGQGIGAGRFPVSPYMYKKKNACSFCDYKSVCRFESRRNTYNYLPDLTEEEALNKMRDALGIQVKEEGGEA